MGIVRTKRALYRNVLQMLEKRVGNEEMPARADAIMPELFAPSFAGAGAFSLRSGVAGAVFCFGMEDGEAVVPRVR